MSQYKRELGILYHLANHDEGKFGEEFVNEVCPKILTENLLSDLQEEQQFGNFMSMFCSSLPELMSRLPSNVVDRIVTEIENSEWIPTFRISCLYHRLRNKAIDAPAFLVMLRESFRDIEECFEYVLAKFTVQLLRTFVSLKIDKIYEEAIIESLNRFFGCIFESRVEILSHSIVAKVIQMIIGRVDVLAPSPEAIIASPQECTTKSVLSVALILGQLNAYFSKFSLLSEIKNLYLKYPTQVRMCVKYLMKVKVQFSEYRESEYVICALEEKSASAMELCGQYDSIEAAFREFIMNVKTQGHSYEALHDLMLILKVVKRKSSYGVIRTPLLVVVLSQCMRIFPVLLYQQEFRVFVKMAKLILRILETCFFIFDNRGEFMTPILHYVDILLISPFCDTDKPMTFASYEIKRCLEKVSALFIDNHEEWFAFLWEQTPSFALNYILMKIITSASSDTLSAAIEEILPTYIKKTAAILDTLSYQALLSVADLWITTVSFLVDYSQKAAVRFAYACVKFANDTSLSFRRSSIEGCCYFLQFLTMLFTSPLFSMTFCSFSEFLTFQLCDPSIYRTNPAVCYRLLELFDILVAKNGNNYESNIMFSYPRYVHIIAITDLCTSCLSDANLRSLAVHCLRSIADNKYCSPMLNLTPIHNQHGIFGRVQDDSITENMLNLQTTINSRVPNRVVKVVLGFELWKESQKRNLSKAEVMKFIEDFLENPI